MSRTVRFASIAFSGLLVATTILPGCSRRKSDSEAKLYVVTTTSIIADAVRSIGGERVKVFALIGPRKDPHTYQVTPEDLVELNAADLIVYNGLGLEAGMESTILDLSQNKRMVAVSRDIATVNLLKIPDQPAKYDPHIWFQPALWIRACETMRDALIEADTGGAELYKSNSDSLRQALIRLNGFVLSRLNGIPPEKRILVTVHDAFRYFGHTFKFETRALHGISTSPEAGTAEIEALSDFLVEKGVDCIFAESSIPASALETLQNSCKSKNHSIRIGGQLFSDTMGKADGETGTFEDMIHWNVNSIVKALVHEKKED